MPKYTIPDKDNKKNENLLAEFKMTLQVVQILHKLNDTATMTFFDAILISKFQPIKGQVFLFN